MTATLLKRLRVAAATVAGLALAGIGLAGPAAADPLPPSPTSGTISVHKFQAPENTIDPALPNNGTVADTSGLTPMEGVGFTLQQVTGIDLTTNAGWQAANTMVGSFDPSDISAYPPAPYGLGASVTKSTNAAGAAVFSDLPLGLYLVTETSYVPNATPSAPFLVTLPITNPVDHTGWLFEVHVYPKHSIDTATKTVADADDVKFGDQVVWTVTADIPNVKTIDPAATSLTGYKITDDLDAKLDYVSTAVRLSGDDAPALTPGTDYTVTPEAFTAGGPVVTVEFTDTGLKLLAENSTRQVVVDITTTVNAVGEIKNTATLFPGKPGGDWTTGYTTPEVETRWGTVDVLKKDETGAALQGAEFRVWAEVSNPDTSAGQPATVKVPVTVNGVSTWTSDGNGKLTIAGLRYSRYADGVDLAATGEPFADGFVKYWLEEVKAPAGYELLAQPISFEVSDADTAIEFDVTNVPSNAGFRLPLTGGSGTAALYAAGALLLGGALVLVVRSRRRDAN